MTLTPIGDMLACLALAGAKTGKVEPVKARMCSGCAFKKGTPANGEKPAAERALECLMSSGQLVFNCHQERDRRCGGFLLAKAADE